MSQMGHTSATLVLELYAMKMARSRDTGARMDALSRTADWSGERAQKSANGSGPVHVFTQEERKSRISR